MIFRLTLLGDFATKPGMMDIIPSHTSPKVVVQLSSNEDVRYVGALLRSNFALTERIEAQLYKPHQEPLPNNTRLEAVFTREELNVGGCVLMYGLAHTEDATDKDGQVPSTQTDQPMISVTDVVARLREEPLGRSLQKPAWARVESLRDKYEALVVQVRKESQGRVARAKAEWLREMSGLCGGDFKAFVQRLMKEEHKRGRKRAREETTSLASDVAEELLCPISQTLPLDPVIAEDGHLYDRPAILRWLCAKERSPMTNAPMGRRLLPAPHAKRTIRTLIESGAIAPGDVRAQEWEELLGTTEPVDVACLYARHIGIEDLARIRDIFPTILASERLRYIEKLHSVSESMFVAQVPCYTCSYCRRSKHKTKCQNRTPWRPEWLQHGAEWIARQKSG